MLTRRRILKQLEFTDFLYCWSLNSFKNIFARENTFCTKEENKTSSMVLHGHCSMITKMITKTSESREGKQQRTRFCFSSAPQGVLITKQVYPSLCLLSEEDTYKGARDAWHILLGTSYADEFFHQPVRICYIFFQQLLVR